MISSAAIHGVGTRRPATARAIVDTATSAAKTPQAGTRLTAAMMRGPATAGAVQAA